MTSYSAGTIRAQGLAATVSEKGQVTIPKSLRDSLGLRPGTKIAFLEDAGGVLVAAKVVDDDPFRELWGIAKLPDGVSSVDELMEELRGPVDIP